MHGKYAKNKPRQSVVMKIPAGNGGKPIDLPLVTELIPDVGRCRMILKVVSGSK